MFHLDRYQKGIVLFSALNDHTRMAILQYLYNNQHKRHRVTDLRNSFGIGQALMSTKLRTLRHVGLVNATREGKEIYYWVDPEKFKVLGDVCGLLTKTFFSDEDRTKHRP
jgi:DNA-binding transcriptional ArsR family regulator